MGAARDWYRTRRVHKDMLKSVEELLLELPREYSTIWDEAAVLRNHLELIGSMNDAVIEEKIFSFLRR